MDALLLRRLLLLNKNKNIDLFMCKIFLTNILDVVFRKVLPLFKMYVRYFLLFFNYPMSIESKKREPKY
jgi:hypothetical protein